MNQLLAGLAFLVIAFYLLRHRRPLWFLIPPLVLMLIVPGWAMCYEIGQWWSSGRYLLFGLGLVIEIIQIWIIIEAVLMWPKAKGVLPEPLPPLPKAVGLATAGGNLPEGHSGVC